MSRNGKLEIQNIVERIVARHNIDPSHDFYLKLTMQPYMDLVMERNGGIILVGHYREENGEISPLSFYVSPIITSCYC